MSEKPEYVDTETKSSDKGWEGSRAHLLSLPVGTVYKGFEYTLVEIVRDEDGEVRIKQYPRDKALEAEFAKTRGEKGDE